MEKLIVLGTGNASVKKCYNTCFALQSHDEYFLIDAGGGNQILSRLEDQMNIKMESIHHLFVTHAHTDHLLGVIWVIRMIATQMNNHQYEGEFHIYAHTELIEAIKTISNLTLQSKLTKLFDHQIIFHELQDGMSKEILGHTFTFFDVLSTKLKQFGFTFYNGQSKISFTGDEPYNEACFKYVKKIVNGYSMKPFVYMKNVIYLNLYQKHHSTVKDGALLAQKLGVKILLLWHTEERNLTNRKFLYTKEAKEFFDGNVFVPDDLEVIKL